MDKHEPPNKVPSDCDHNPYSYVVTCPECDLAEIERLTAEVNRLREDIGLVEIRCDVCSKGFVCYRADIGERFMVGAYCSDDCREKLRPMLAGVWSRAVVDKND